jgi:hypothetical protein
VASVWAAGPKSMVVSIGAQKRSYIAVPAKVWRAPVRCSNLSIVGTFLTRISIRTKINTSFRFNHLHITHTHTHTHNGENR